MNKQDGYLFLFVLVIALLLGVSFLNRLDINQLKVDTQLQEECK